MLARAHTFTIEGLQTRPVTVEVDIRAGLPAFTIVGLADAAVREARDRVHAAVLNDCVNCRMFSVWTASKRLKIHLPSAEALGFANLWFNLFDLYEIGLLPIINNFSLRSFAVRLRRWREPVEVANILLRRIFLRQRFSVSRIYPVRAPI